MNDDAAPFVAKGKTAFCKFVLDCDPEIRALEEVLLVDKDDNLLATGQALLCAAEIKDFKKGGFVYSTNPDFDFEQDDNAQETTLTPGEQDLRVMLDRKQRKGKVVTLVTGFKGNDEDLKELGKALKSKCGTGGTVKDGEIIIQGDFKNKVGDLLKEMGYPFKYSGGN